MKKFVLGTLAVFGLASAANAALIAGDIAIIGRTNNGTPDVFTIVTLAPISAGEVVYFTDNGWLTAGGFRGVTATDGDGNEGLTKITFNNAVAAGSIISTNSSSPNFTWATSGTIGNNTTLYTALALSTSGDQITAFQTTEVNDPAFVTGSMTPIYQFDDTNAFENAADSATGNLMPGITVAGGTASLINAQVGGTIAFNTSSLQYGTKSEWLAAISNPTNWSSNTLPSGSIVVPEPTTLCTIGTLAAVSLRRRRK